MDGHKLLVILFLLTGSVQRVSIGLSCGNGVGPTPLASSPGDFSVKFDNAYVVPIGTVVVKLQEFSID